MALKFPSGRDQPGHDRIGSDLITMNEAAEYLRISRRTLNRMKAGGIGPVWIRIGLKIFYRKADLNGFISSQALREKP